MYSAIIGIEVPDVNTSPTPISFSAGMSFSGMIPPTSSSGHHSQSLHRIPRFEDRSLHHLEWDISMLSRLKQSANILWKTRSTVTRPGEEKVFTDAEVRTDSTPH